MFYAHFVLSKRGPLARIWLAAHWDKKLTKAHVFETNIDSSVEAILQPKVKMALRTSGHLLLGVVRIYSRKAKYLLADCNEAFVKIKMAFRPGIVDLPEDNREAAVNAITLPENFHDFDTTMADLNDIDVQAQFSVNQSRPEEITMREDLGNITLIGDDGFGDSGYEDDDLGGSLDGHVMHCIMGDLETPDKDNPVDMDKILRIIDLTLHLDDRPENCRCGETTCVVCEHRRRETCVRRLSFDSVLSDAGTCSECERLKAKETHPSEEELHENVFVKECSLYCSKCKRLLSDICDTTKTTNAIKARNRDSGVVLDSDDDHTSSDSTECANTNNSGTNHTPAPNKGDYGFDDTREMLRDPAHSESLYKNPDASNLTLVEGDKSGEKPMEIDEFAGGMKNDDFGDDGEGFMAMGGDSSDDDNEDNFGGDVDHELFGDGFNMDGGGLFEDAPMAEVSMVPEIQPSEIPEKEVEKEKAPVVPHQEDHVETTLPNATGEQTTLMSNVEEAFALEPLDVTVTPGFGERKAKRKRKLIVDEQKGIPSESMKLQLSDSSDIVTTLDLAPPTKKLMHWKETGGVEKLFALSGRRIPSKSLAKMFVRNLVTRALEDWEEKDELQDSLQLDPPEIPRDEEHPFAGDLIPQKEYSTIIEEPSILSDTTIRSRRDKSLQEKPAEMPSFQEPPAVDFQQPEIEMPPEPEIVPPEKQVEQPNEENENEALDSTQEEARVTKRTQQMLLTLTRLMHKQKTVGFKELTHGNNKKQAASKFYTFLVLRKQQAINVTQSEPYADIIIKKGPKFETVY